MHGLRIGEIRCNVWCAVILQQRISNCLPKVCLAFSVAYAMDLHFSFPINLYIDTFDA